MEQADIVSRRWMVREEELDDDQYRIRMLRSGDFLVEGCAGSGKTILALQKAKEIQDADQGTYLVVIYTLALSTFIKDGITSLGLDPDRICIFDRLDKLGYDEVDHVIVDEVQDFSQGDIMRLKNMAKKSFIFFGDDAQQLYNKGTSLTAIQSVAEISKVNRKKLYKNYRLPVPIAKFAEYVATRSDGLVTRCVKQTGEKPLILKFGSPDEEIRYISDLIRREGWTDVGIMADTNARVGYLRAMFQRYDLDVEAKCNNGNQTIGDLDFYTSKPKLMTFHSSKGLQFEHVILPMCNSGGNNYHMQDALYVAITRASQDLLITFTDVLSPHLQVVPRQLYVYREL